jgi:hypothetical protein
MPNIELHGLNRSIAESFRGAIFKAIGAEDKKLLADTVVTICNDYCVDAQNKGQPYMRICCTNLEEIKRLKDILQPFALDKEILHLTEFIPAGS